MHLRISMLTILVVLLLSGSAAANDFLPDDVANTWTYEANSAAHGVRITHSTHNWRRYDDFAGLGAQWIWTHERSGSVYGWNPSRGAMEMFDTTAPVGSRYKVHLSPCAPETVTLAAKNQRVRTGAGTFDDVLQLTLTNQCADAGTAAIWFAPKVGIIKWEEISLIGSSYYELASAHVEGVDYPTHRAAFTLSMAPSRDTVWLNLMPAIGPPRRHDTSVTVRLEFANTGDRQIDLDFPSSQRFDIFVTDENGATVQTWSANKSFAGVASTLRLKPGDARSYEGTVRLPEKEGRYTLRMQLTSKHRRVAAETSIEVIAVY